MRSSGSNFTSCLLIQFFRFINPFREPAGIWHRSRRWWRGFRDNDFEANENHGTTGSQKGDLVEIGCVIGCQGLVFGAIHLSFKLWHKKNTNHTHIDSGLRSIWKKKTHTSMGSLKSSCRTSWNHMRRSKTRTAGDGRREEVERQKKTLKNNLWKHNGPVRPVIGCARKWFQTELKLDTSRSTVSIHTSLEHEPLQALFCNVKIYIAWLGWRGCRGDARQQPLNLTGYWFVEENPSIFL